MKPIVRLNDPKTKIIVTDHAITRFIQRVSTAYSTQEIKQGLIQGLRQAEIAYKRPTNRKYDYNIQIDFGNLDILVVVLFDRNPELPVKVLTVKV